MNVTMPTNRDENWRYANLRPLAKARADAVIVERAASVLARPPALPGYEHWVFIDGQWSPELSTPKPVSTLWVDRRDVHNSAVAFDRLLDVELASAGVDFALARANATHGSHVLMVRSPAGGELLEIELTFIATQPADVGTSYPRVQVMTGRRGRIRLIERHLSAAAAPSAINAAVDIGLGPESEVDHVRLQNCSDNASCFDTLVANVGERASYRLRTVTLGGLSSRSTVFIRLAGRAARCELTAASIANGIQTHDTFAEIEHLGAETVTSELYRGIATDRGKLAFNGKMIVRADAHEADSDQSLKTLLSGSGAEAAARPQLEIYTDRVRAKHGATTGKLDEHMLFYLLSRGIDRPTAQALLQWAFIEDAICRIEPAAVRQEVEALVAAQLREVSALDGLLGKP